MPHLARQFVRLQELAPVVGARRHQPQQVFRTEDGHREGPHSPRQGRGGKEAAGPHQRRAIRQECLGGGHMLHDFHGQHRVELCAAGDQFARLHRPVVDLQAGLGGMGTRHGDGLGCRIDPGDPGAQPGQRLGKQAATATDIDQPQPLERARKVRVAPEMAADLAPQEGQAGRVDGMQAGHFARRIPPGIGRQCPEAGQFRRIGGSVVEGPLSVIGGSSRGCFSHDCCLPVRPAGLPCCFRKRHLPRLRRRTRSSM